ncbi:unnamed protein product [Rotaria magnacalcarata]|uniref:Reverse transcriptase domain-containing protein n=2 Tax=Rotaria magnacalcarata TaxID=392030 RepID=A0A816TUI9_9BILA|nr:unnamed protein product [Rotaria magnacalcarata]
MLKILQARLEQYMARELPDVPAGFRSGRGTRDHIANIRWIMGKAREFQKYIYLCFIDYTKAFDCVDHNKLWTVLNDMGVLKHLICLLKNLYTDQEATVRTEYGLTEWFKNEKGVRQGCILSPCLFNLYAEYIMRSAELDETEVGIKISGRNINNLRYADDTTLMAENEDHLKTLLMKVKEESAKADLLLNIKNTKVMSTVGIVSQQPVLFDMSIRENIAYDDNSRNDISLNKIMRRKEVKILQYAYVFLSDHPTTSALDSENEKIAQEALDRAQQNRTSITIAHRLSTIENADIICIVHNGSIVKSGSDEEFLAMGGRYYRLATKGMR